MCIFKPIIHTLYQMFTERMIKSCDDHILTSYPLQSISPGVVKTEIVKAAGIDTTGMNLGPPPALEAEDISDAVHYVIATPPNVNVS